MRSGDETMDFDNRQLGIISFILPSLLCAHTLPLHFGTEESGNEPALVVSTFH